MLPQLLLWIFRSVSQSSSSGWWREFVIESWIEIEYMRLFSEATSRSGFVSILKHYWMSHVVCHAVCAVVVLRYGCLFESSMFKIIINNESIGKCMKTWIKSFKSMAHIHHWQYWARFKRERWSQNNKWKLCKSDMQKVIVSEAGLQSWAAHGLI